MSRIVKVVQSIIVKGRPGFGASCPVALAINETLGAGFRAVVGHSSFSIRTTMECETPNTLVYIEDLPMEVSNRIRAYDVAKAMEPFEFVLDIPEEFQNRKEENL